MRYRSQQYSGIEWKLHKVRRESSSTDAYGTFRAVMGSQPQPEDDYLGAWAFETLLGHLPSLQKNILGFSDAGFEPTRRSSWSSSSALKGAKRGTDLVYYGRQGYSSVIQSKEAWQEERDEILVSGVKVGSNNLIDFELGSGDGQINYGTMILTAVPPTGTGYINLSKIKEYWNGIYVGDASLTNIKRMVVVSDLIDSYQMVTGGWLATKVTDTGDNPYLYNSGTNLYMKYHEESGVTNRHAVIGSGKVRSPSGGFEIFGSGTAIPSFGLVDRMNPVTGWKIQSGVNDVLSVYNPSTAFPVFIKTIIAGVSGAIT